MYTPLNREVSKTNIGIDPRDEETSIICYLCLLHLWMDHAENRMTLIVWKDNFLKCSWKCCLTFISCDVRLQATGLNLVKSLLSGSNRIYSWTLPGDGQWPWCYFLRKLTLTVALRLHLLCNISSRKDKIELPISFASWIVGFDCTFGDLYPTRPKSNVSLEKWLTQS